MNGFDRKFKPKYIDWRTTRRSVIDDFLKLWFEWLGNCCRSSRGLSVIAELLVFQDFKTEIALPRVAMHGRRIQHFGARTQCGHSRFITAFAYLIQRQRN